VGVVAVRGGEHVEVDAGTVLLCAGAYASPAILMRSGVGDPAHLREAGVQLRHPLPAVGAHLVDHPAVLMYFRGSEKLERSVAEATAAPWVPPWQTLAKVASSQSNGGFDIHLYPTHAPGPDGGVVVEVGVSCMTPRSIGSVRLQSADPATAPIIEHNYLTDRGHHDMRVTIEGVQLARKMFPCEPLARLVEEELAPSRRLETHAQLAGWCRESVVHYFHPVGTCRMGAGPAGSVTDARGRVHGLENVVIGDASILPVIPDANTLLPVAAAADRVADWMLE
jgi:choline dehydrogenase